jgi:hypothetical protein
MRMVFASRRLQRLSVLLLCAAALLLPLRGLAHSLMPLMQLSMPAGVAAANQQAMQAPVHHSMPCHGGAADGGGDAQAHPEQGSASALACQLCAMCHASLAFLPLATKAPVALGATPAPAFQPLMPPSAVLILPDEPPRA